MQDLIVEQLRGKFQELPFITKFGGLAQTIRTTSELGAPKRFPVSRDPDLLAKRDKQPDQYESLVPDGNEAGVAYFEHRSLKTSGIERGNLLVCESVLRLVYWGKLGNDYQNSLLAQAAIIKRVPDAMYTASPLSALIHRVSAVLLQQDNLFDQYTYSEPEMQYLMSPYGAFAIEITSNFKVALSCLPADGPVGFAPFNESHNTSYQS